MAILVKAWWCNSSYILPLQPIAAHSSIANPCTPLLHGTFCQGKGIIPHKSTHCSPLQPTLLLQPLAPHSYMAVFVKGKVKFLKNPPIANHCSSLLHDIFRQGIFPRKFSTCSPLQPVLTWQFRQGVVVYFLKKRPIAAQCSPLLYVNFS